MEYTEKDLVKIAKRENNTKRNYLVVDPLQGKHIPVVPSKALIYLLLWQILSGRNTKMKNFCWWALRRQQLP